MPSPWPPDLRLPTELKFSRTLPLDDAETGIDAHLHRLLIWMVEALQQGASSLQADL
ncbi:MAG: hypothetical protein K0S77_2531, partial [Pseudomonas sp.]|nr:hypothetical protein [Pseudomonas sp.]